MIAARTRFESLRKARDAGITMLLDTAKQQFRARGSGPGRHFAFESAGARSAIAQDVQGGIVREANRVTIGDAVRVRLWKGALDCRVEGAETE